MDHSNQDASILQSDVKLEGILSFDGTFHLNGNFKGNIFAGGTLVVGDRGRISADVNVAALVSSGEIYGNIVADQRVQIRSPGKVVGDIVAPVVIIEPGAHFEGRCRRPDENQAQAMHGRTAGPYTPPIKKIA